MKNNILVVGPSSAGKSTYIKKLLNDNELNDYKVFMAHEFPNNNVPIENCIFHYNTFNAFKNFNDNWQNALKEDEFLNEVFEKSKSLEIHLLLVDRLVLLKRILLRKQVEPIFRNKKSKYPGNKFINILFSIDYVKFYRETIMFFESKNIELIILDSNQENFDKIEVEEKKIFSRSSEINVNYTKNEIEEIITNFQFEYQKIDLPYGLSTKGQDRDNTSNFIFKNSLEGKSVLDVGCAYGYFCFEAEKRNANRVLGTELKEHRFNGANILKTIKGSEVEFLRQDIIKDRVDEKFDTILLLNVIHHLEFPFYSLKVLSEMCKDTLIIEYPTLDDEKFRSSTKMNWFRKSNKPYVGVSLLKEKDQTFVFNDEALKRFLIDNFSYFHKVEFYKSPFDKSRRLAICKK
ncbi:class I SAM-dependent methyltransferase [Lutimonas zeaxanthinifaciens]|uniref:class I SAM-dependent methyltransferase n=1 Tax=Lutimonas zeaxanthinifaciens TaxID=3060215 RepID=UPI00265CB814|nr:methyltransferase domain-containing protein [Lutimonas sp. YSD2104]WKK67345.1 methyltransferase domain-containing protein [Lutimonas sp. YSD2104]